MPAVTLDDLKLHLNMGDVTADDALLTSQLARAKTFVAGYLADGISVDDVTVDGVTTSPPDGVNQAVLMVAACFYADREADSGYIPCNFLDLLGSSRAWGF